MSFTDALPLLAGLALGAMLARLVEKSGFSVDRMLRWPSRYGEGEWRRSWWLAVALLWLAAAAVSLTPLRGAAAPIEAGPLAAAAGGLLAGAAMMILAGDVVSLGYETGHTSVPAAAGFVSWVLGYLAAAHGVLAPLTRWLRSAGLFGIGPGTRLAGLGGSAAALAGEDARPAGEAVAAFVVPAAAAVLVLARMMREPVRVVPGRMEWPKQGGGLALLVLLGWLLAAAGGENAGLNAVSAVESVRGAVVAGRLWLHPSILVTMGIVGYALLRALRRRELFVRSVGSARHAFTVVAAGAVLGVSSALTGGDPSAHAFFGFSTMSVGSILFVAFAWMGARAAGRFDRRHHGRPGGGEA